MSDNIGVHLVGIKKVYHYNLDEINIGLSFNLLQSKRGGYTHSLKEWWRKRSGVQYVDCTVFKFMCHDERYYRLAVVSNNQTSLRFTHDGYLNFTFNSFKNVSRAALFTEDFQLIEHYVFPYDSRGKALTVIPQDGIQKPEFHFPLEELESSDDSDSQDTSDHSLEDNQEEPTQNTDSTLPVVELSRPDDEETTNN